MSCNVSYIFVNFRCVKRRLHTFGAFALFLCVSLDGSVLRSLRRRRRVRYKQTSSSGAARRAQAKALVCSRVGRRDQLVYHCALLRLRAQQTAALLRRYGCNQQYRKHNVSLHAVQLTLPRIMHDLHDLYNIALSWLTWPKIIASESVYLLRRRFLSDFCLYYYLSEYL